MGYLRSVPRTQAMLLPECVEDFVGPENPVRVIDAFVEGLDLVGLGWPQLDEGLPGAKSYDPKVLLKLYIYGYLNRVRSSRELEKATYRNLEVIWLLGRLTPDHWTINAFRRTHRTRFQAVFRQFNLLCSGLGLFGAELVAIDGTFLKGVNNPARNFTKAKVERVLKEIDERTEAYLATLEMADAEAASQGLGAAGGVGGASAQPTDGAPLRERVARLQQDRQEYAALLARLAAEPGTQLSLTDPDSRLLQKAAQTVVGYNAQVAVDATHHLIAAQEVTRDPNDTQQLAPMAEAACAALGVEKIAALGDTGFYNIEQLARCAAQGIETYVPAPRPARVAGDGSYPDTSFRYAMESDSYHCPQGQVLTRQKDTEMTSGRYRVYANAAACRTCPVRATCTSGAYRRINVHEHAETVAAARARLAAKPDMMARRQGIVEHVFGTIKFWMGHGAFLTQGLEMVRAEFSLSCLAYNLRRTLNLVDVPALLTALQAAGGPKTTAAKA